MVHFNRLASFAGDNNEDHRGATVRRILEQEPTFNEFMDNYSTGHKARYGVTREEQQDLFAVSSDYSLAHCVASDLKMSRGIASVFKKKYGRLEELANQRPPTLHLKNNNTKHKRYLYYLVTKSRSCRKPTYRTLWDTLLDLRKHLLDNDIMKLAVPKLGCGLDGLDWRVVRNMLETLFRCTGIEILVCSFNPRTQANNKRTIDCHFFKTSGCIKGNECRFRHQGLFRDETVLRRGQCNERRVRNRSDGSNDCSRVKQTCTNSHANCLHCVALQLLRAV